MSALDEQADGALARFCAAWPESVEGWPRQALRKVFAAYPPADVAEVLGVLALASERPTLSEVIDMVEIQARVPAFRRRAPVRGANQHHRALAGVSSAPAEWESAWYFALALRAYWRAGVVVECERDLRDLTGLLADHADPDVMVPESVFAGRYAALDPPPHAGHSRVTWHEHLCDVLDAAVQRTPASMAA